VRVEYLPTEYLSLTQAQGRRMLHIRPLHSPPGDCGSLSIVLGNQGLSSHSMLWDAKGLSVRLEANLGMRTGRSAVVRVGRERGRATSFYLMVYLFTLFSYSYFYV